MKKLLILTVALLAIPALQGAFGDTVADTVAYNAKKATEAASTAVNNLIDLYKPGTMHIWGANPLTEPVATDNNDDKYQAQQKEKKEAFKTATDAIVYATFESPPFMAVIDAIEQDAPKITLADIKGLIIQLNGYANGRLTGVPLHKDLQAIFDSVKDRYKQLVDLDNTVTASFEKLMPVSTLKQGKLLGQGGAGEQRLRPGQNGGGIQKRYPEKQQKRYSKNAQLFLQALIYDIVKGKQKQEKYEPAILNLETPDIKTFLPVAEGKYTAG